MTKRLVLLSAVLFAAAFNAFPQSGRMTGRVTEVIDGRTVRLELPHGAIRAELQGIDVPEPEQPLHQLVKDHLKALTVGRDAEFVLDGLTTNRTVGQLMVNGVDVSAQMLRDGAAWLVPLDYTTTPTAAYAAYANNETQARNEKLGIWSLPDLKPAWQVRVEKAESQRLQEDDAWRAANVKWLKNKSTASNSLTPGRPQAPQSVSHTAAMNAWNEVIAGVGRESFGLKVGRVEAMNFNYILTSGTMVDMSSRTSRQRLEFRSIYGYWGAAGGASRFAFGFRSLADDFKYGGNKRGLTLVVDGRPLTLTYFTSFKAQSSIGAHEIYFYNMSRATLRRIAAATVVEIRVNGMSGRLPAEAKQLMRQLADAA